MKTLLRILPIIFLMIMLFACKKDNGGFTPPYQNGGIHPPYLTGNQDATDTSGVSTKNRDF